MELGILPSRISCMVIRWRALLTAALSTAAIFAQQTNQEPEMPEANFGTTVVIPAGLRGSVYSIPKDTTVLPDFAHGPVQRISEIWTNDLNIRPRHWREGFPGLTERSEWFAIDYTGRFWIATPGRYVFALVSDDGSRLFLDDTPVVDNDCQHPPDLRTAAVQLEGGVHRIRISYFQGPRDCLALVLAIAGPDRQWKLFDVRNFTPPSNPEEWHFSATSSLAILPTTPEEAMLTVNALTKYLPTSAAHKKLKTRSKAGYGCLAPPVRTCGN